MSLKVKTLLMGKGIFEENCYIIFCEDSLEAIIVDPGCFSKSEVSEVLAAVSSFKLNVKFIVNTHGHLDHIGGNSALKDATGASIAVHARDAAMLTSKDLNGSAVFGFSILSYAADLVLADGDKLVIGKHEGVVRHTPGHTSGGICLVFPGMVFSGDTLLSRSIGRTDLPGGSLAEELLSIREKLFVLPDETVVMSGHGCATTIGDEKRYNSFLQ